MSNERGTMSTEFTKENISKIETQLFNIEKRLSVVNQRLKRTKTINGAADGAGIFCVIGCLVGLLYDINFLIYSGGIIAALSIFTKYIFIQVERNLLEEKSELLEGLHERNEWMSKARHEEK